MAGDLGFSSDLLALGWVMEEVLRRPWGHTREGWIQPCVWKLLHPWNLLALWECSCRCNPEQCEASVARGAWLAPAVVRLQEPVLPPPLPVTTKNALPDASKINYGIKIALFKSFILCY